MAIQSVSCDTSHIQNMEVYMDEMNEYVAPESNNTQARLPYKGIVPVTTSTLFPSIATFSGVRD
jgi:hypothetical protein